MSPFLDFNALHVFHGFDCRFVIPHGGHVWQLAEDATIPARSRFSREFWETVVALCAAGF